VTSGKRQQCTGHAAGMGEAKIHTEFLLRKLFEDVHLKDREGNGVKTLTRTSGRQTVRMGGEWNW